MATHQFYFWRRKLTKPKAHSDSRDASGLVPIRIVSDSLSSGLCIQFASGATIDATAASLRDAIEQILATKYALRGTTSQLHVTQKLGFLDGKDLLNGFDFNKNTVF